ncbi:hypothetical protein GGR56DRAFT_675403 [Xylariaceae sp. FL0804]|nr:hypothetical protein GGR56DRAFT_675403 [Xylariaceae sp. FL0804]
MIRTHEPELSRASRFAELGARRVTVQLGPYTVPSRGADSSNGKAVALEPDAAPPCRDCVVTWMRCRRAARRRRADGAAADPDSGGVMLHHLLARYQVGQRFFAFGNERTEVDICEGGLDVAAELMNLRNANAESLRAD